MTGFQELTPQQKMIEAINTQSASGLIESMRLGANPSEITDQNLRSKLLEMLREDDDRTFRWAAQYTETRIFKSLIQLAEEFGGKELVIEMLRTGGDYSIFSSVVHFRRTETVKYLGQLVKSLGGNELAEMLQTDNYYAFRLSADYDYRLPSIDESLELVKYLIELAEKLGGTALVTEMLKAGDYRTFRSAAYEDKPRIKYYIATNPYLDIGGREVVRKELLKTPHITVAGVKTPSPDDFGVIGKPYQYAAMSDSLAKIKILTEGLEVASCNIKQIIANHKNPHRGGISLVHKDEVNWSLLSEVLRPVSHKNCNEIVDTAKEVTQYISAYLLAQQHPDKTALTQLTKEQLNEQLEPIKQQVYRYFLEGKTLPQMQKLSDEWHKYRANKVKSSEDGTTLRDFAQTGSWKQALPTEKEIAVTDPKLAGYTIENLTSSADLMREHYALKHCIDGYTENCKKGYQVFAIRKDGKPQTTMGFNVVDGKLQFHQNYGYKDRVPNADEKAVEKWFREGVENGKIKLDLSNIGEIKLDEKGKQSSEFEDLVGIRLENLTPERLQSNLNILTGFAKGAEKWRAKDQHFMFGSENKGATLEQFTKTIESGTQQQQRTHS